MQPPQIILTHNRSFHPDDVFAVATLLLHLGDTPYEIIRTRDEAKIKQADWVIDVGGIYDPSQQRFDHHQNGAPVRENGIPYAAFGLVWKTVGPELCESTAVADHIDQLLAQPIDAGDNGITLYEVNDYGVSPAELFSVIMSYRPLSGSDQDYDAAFPGAVAFAKGYIERTIAHLKTQEEKHAYIAKTYREAKDPQILEFDQTINRSLLAHYPDARFAIYPRDTGDTRQWCAVSIPELNNPFSYKIRFPENWAGLSNEALAEVSGIPDAVFCHKARFIFVAEHRDSAVQAAQQALHTAT